MLMYISILCAIFLGLLTYVNVIDNNAANTVFFSVGATLWAGIFLNEIKERLKG